ncbi:MULTISPECIES: hypothetical protein [Rhodococcus]|uniref:hypothetical protein n=1 Tax=Rhodococcus TaxID=1827 RepID=UPI001E5A0101|nr:hypothetical protein [Rhodococcus pyridinivorans]MCD2119286.1 hypothetical protein [Rhodococcus pyridinivorans]MCZ4628240.1 hypothetical protein [Rhodococcus pyridinivorans]MCZ4649436.1 hypothetical protein [Rhodococcus pyridinivorans]MDJ0484493.1 hypothetical protein [Rhodococcus pyridinivorans]MDV7255529.1 hypothetical protein [Rhodococcus pyridinivorans]
MRPTYAELVTEQDTVLALPMTGAQLVTGGPGTGKTAMAVYRALLHRAAGDTPLVVVPDQLRKVCMVRRFSINKNAARIMTQWELLDLMVPGLRGSGAEGPEFWMQALVAVAKRRPTSAATPGAWALIVDDAHDMPPEFHQVTAMFAKRSTILHDPSVVFAAGQATVAAVEKAYQPQSRATLTMGHRWNGPKARLASSLVPDRVLPVAVQGMSDRGAVTAQGVIDERELARIVAALARVSRGQRIAVTCRTEGRFQLLSEYLRRAVEEKAFTPIWPKRTGQLKQRASGAGVTLIRENLVCGVEFDKIVIAELDSVVDDVTAPAHRVPLYRAVASARGSVHLAWFDEGAAEQLLRTLEGVTYVS